MASNTDPTEKCAAKRKQREECAAKRRQPDEANTITRTLFVGLAMVESTAIYCFVVAMILLFANPFWNFLIAQAENVIQTGG